MQVCIKQPEAQTHAFSTSEELLHHATGGVAQVFQKGSPQQLEEIFEQVRTRL